MISLPKVLASMSVGDRHYLETTLEKRVTKMMTITSTISRVAPIGCRFTTTYFTAVGARPGDIRYLVCVERAE